MRYLMKKKLLAMGDDFTIKDANGNDAFYVDGKVFTLRDRLIFQDMSGSELCVIQKKLLSWGTTYEIYHLGQLKAVVKEALFTLVGHRFTVNDEQGRDDLECAATLPTTNTPSREAARRWPRSRSAGFRSPTPTVLTWLMARTMS